MKKTVMIITIFLLCVSGGYIVSDIYFPKIEQMNSLEEISGDTLEALIEKSENGIIYVGDKNCSPCKEFTPKIEQLVATGKADIKYIEASRKNNNRALEELKIQYTPTILIVREGVVTQRIGTLEEWELEEAIKE